jgi:hypothetical protein
MRTLRIFAIVATATLSTVSLFFHFLGLGAFAGAVLCVWLWRYLLIDWLKAGWHAIVDDLRKGP